MLIWSKSSNEFDMDSALKGAEALYSLDLLALFLELEEMAIQWKARVS